MMGDPGNVAWSPDGRTIVCQRDGTISVLLAAANGKRLAGIEHPDARHYEAVAFSPDSSQLACASLTHVVHLWDFAAMRRGLAALNLDWDLPPPQPRLPPESPLVVRVIPSPAPAVSLPPAADR
jgi:WD40 repeat protein